MFLLTGLAVCLSSGGASAPAQDSKLPRANEVVKPRVSIPRETVPRGKTLEVIVFAEIHPGFHIQANRVLEDYLIPTTLEAQLPDGLRVLETRYPKALLRKFPFNPKEMAVYEGKVDLRIKLAVETSAPLGHTKLPLALRYQACTDAACLPPVTLPLSATFEIVPASAPSPVPPAGSAATKKP